MSVVCVTNSMRGVKSCLTTGEHHDLCDGFRGGKECRGCLPRRAAKGLLCFSCWERVTLALSRWFTFAEVISGIDRAVTPENIGGGGKPGSRLPIPQTWLDVDETESYLAIYESVGHDAKLWVSSMEGAKSAINFVISAERAFRSHPVEERAHRVRTSCPSCQHKSLVWNPVLTFGGEVSVTCSFTGCGYVADQSEYELLALNESQTKTKRNDVG